MPSLLPDRSRAQTKFRSGAFFTAQDAIRWFGAVCMLLAPLLLSVVPASADVPNPARNSPAVATIAPGFPESDPGPVWDPQNSMDATQHKVIVDAVENAARTSARPIMVIVSRPPGTDTPEEFISSANAAWPDRAVFVVLRRDNRVALHTPESGGAQLPANVTQALTKRISSKLYESYLPQAIANVIHDFGEEVAGRSVPQRSALHHPLEIAHGQDAPPVPKSVFVVATVAFSIFLLLLLWVIYLNPKGFLKQVGRDMAGEIIGGAVGGGGGSFSGGGGTFGGGGANGSW